MKLLKFRGRLSSIQRSSFGGLAVCGGMISSCVIPFPLAFSTGSFEGALTCAIDIAGPDDGSGQDEVIASISLVVEDGARFSTNGVEIAVGAEVTRALPNADLTFEVTSVTATENLLTVTYVPRPTLPGITIEGTLIETYRPRIDGIAAGAVTTLIITDIEGDVSLSVNCQGTLLPSAVP